MIKCSENLPPYTDRAMTSVQSGVFRLRVNDLTSIIRGAGVRFYDLFRLVWYYLVYD
jgi:hypothetical protein